MTLLLQNILGQAAALRAVAQQQTGAGAMAMSRAAAVLKNADQVVISGMGASFFAGMSFAYAFRAEAVECSELLYFGRVRPRTVVVLVSRSGESVEVVKLLRQLKGDGIAVVAVTNVPESTLAMESDVAIVSASPPDEMVAIQTYSGTVATFAFLLAALDDVVGDAVSEAQATAAMLDEYVPACVDATEGWDDFLKARGPCYFLGRGPALATVAEGVLLMHETAKVAAVGMSVAQFRHGPVETVDEQFHAVILGTQAETANLEAALANDLMTMKADVRWIGPQVAGCRALSLCQWPNVPSRFRAIAEIVPLQCLAYRKAELEGVRPGAFRWAPQVTASESGF